MRQIEGRPDVTVAQLAQAVDAVYFATGEERGKRIIDELKKSVTAPE